jgi:hypothetical protein
MDGQFYVDLREPHVAADQGTVTLGATYKALYPAGAFPVLGANYFSRTGKAMRIRLFGKMSTGSPVGNLQWAVYYGTGADANGIKLAETVAKALVASAVDLPWTLEADVYCRTPGATGILSATGWSLWNVGLVLSTNAPILLPPSGIANTCDLTAANILSLQALASSGAGVTMTVQGMSVLALN